MLELATENAAFELNGEVLDVVRITELAGQYLKLKDIMNRLSSRYDPLILQGMRRIAPLDQPAEADEERLGRYVDGLTSLLVERADSSISITSAVDFRTPDNWTIVITITQHGLATEHRFNREFFSSPEYKRLATMGEILDSPQAALNVKRGDTVNPAGSLRQGLELLLNESRRLVHVQRYKGLGEMNPEQLWDTTMDAETRNLVQVQIEDAVAADEIFSTLMGDQVEPRRLFIEEHALSVTNLDT